MLFVRLFFFARLHLFTIGTWSFPIFELHLIWFLSCLCYVQTYNIFLCVFRGVQKNTEHHWTSSNSLPKKMTQLHSNLMSTFFLMLWVYLDNLTSRHFCNKSIFKTIWKTDTEKFVTLNYKEILVKYGSL